MEEMWKKTTALMLLTKENTYNYKCNSENNGIENLKRTDCIQFCIAIFFNSLTQMLVK